MVEKKKIVEHISEDDMGSLEDIMGVPRSFGEEPKSNKIDISTVLTIVATLIKQIGERLGEEAFNNLFTEKEYGMLLSPDLDDVMRLALFNNRLVCLFLIFSGKEGKHVLNYISELNPSMGLHEYSHNITKHIIPFIKEFNLLKERAV